MVNYLPLTTSIVAFIFFTILDHQYVKRVRVYQLLWTIAMLFYAVTALMEYLMNSDILGANIFAFRVYYVLAAPLVGLLIAGVMYLLTKRRFAKLFLGFVTVFSLGLVPTGLTATLDQ